MANTTNFNWETPDDTDLVKDGAAAIRTLGSAIDTSLVDLKGGTTGQILSKTSNTDMDFIWVTSDDANAIQNAIVDAKGDIVAASANDTPARLAVGTDNQRLIAASGETTGLKYVSDTQNTVIDAEGDLLVGDAADALQRLAIGTTGQVLTVDTAVDGKVKWAAAGGGFNAQANYVITDQATSSTSLTDLGTVQSVTLTTGTKALILLSAVMYNSGTNVNALSFAVSGATTLAGNNDRTIFNYGDLASTSYSISGAIYYDGLTAGSNTFTMKFRVAGGTGNFYNRNIAVIDMGS
jgi:hypothetical protein